MRASSAPWEGCELPYVTPLVKASTVRLVSHSWRSHQLITMVTAIALSRLLNYPVELVHLGTGEATYAALANGEVHVDMEAWPRSHQALFSRRVYRERALDTLGQAGYSGRSGLYMTPSLVNGSRFHGWHHLRDAEVVSRLPTHGGDGAHDAYVPDGAPCAELDGGCGRLWHVTPEYDAGIVEGLLNELDLNMSVAYLGEEEYLDPMAARVERNEPTLVYNWIPSRLTSRFSAAELTRVSLPEYGRDCEHAHVDEGSAEDSRVSCDFPWQQLLKLAHAGLSRTHEKAFALLARVELRDGQLSALLRELETEGATVEGVACAWLQAHEEAWREWVPPEERTAFATMLVVGVLAGLCGLFVVHIWAWERRRSRQRAALREMAHKRWRRSLRRVLSVNRIRQGLVMDAAMRRRIEVEAARLESEVDGASAAAERGTLEAAGPSGGGACGCGSADQPAGTHGDGGGAAGCTACARPAHATPVATTASEDGAPCIAPEERSAAQPCADAGQDLFMSAPSVCGGSPERPRAACGARRRLPPLEASAGSGGASASLPPELPPRRALGRAHTDSMVRMTRTASLPEGSAPAASAPRPVSRKLSKRLLADSVSGAVEAMEASTPEKQRVLKRTLLFASSVAMLGAAVGIAIAYFTAVERWSVLDSCYFAVAVFTTVGYGDVTPSRADARLFAAFFAMLSTVAVGYALFSFAGLLIETQAAANRQLIQASVKSLSVLSGAGRAAGGAKKLTGEGGPQTPKGAGFVVETPFELALAIARLTMPVLLFLLLGVILGVVVEGWSATDSLYFAVATVTTIGFGDFAPVTMLGRAMACVYLPLSVTAVAKAMQDVSSHVATQWTLRRCSSVEQLLKSSKKASLSKHEFVEHVLLKLYAVEDETVEAIKEHFHRLDRDGSGEISIADLYVPDEAPPPPMFRLPAVGPTVGLVRPHRATMSRVEGSHGAADAIGSRSTSFSSPTFLERLNVSSRGRAARTAPDIASESPEERRSGSAGSAAGARAGTSDNDEDDEANEAMPMATSSSIEV